MLPSELCGAVAAIFLLPFAWTAAATALRALLHRGADCAYNDRIEKLVLALFLAPSFIGLAACIAALMPNAPSLPLPLPEFEFVAFEGSASPPSSAAAAAYVPWLQIGVSVFAWVYLAGVVVAAARLIAAHLRIARIAARAEAVRQWGEGVCVADKDTPPFVGPRNAIILPRTLLSALSPTQISLVIAHERAHIARGDAFYYALLAWADALFWFNPFLRAQTGRCRFAAEVACDASVTAAAPEMRRAYAQALLSALKHTAGDALQCAPAVFSTRIVGEHRMRIREIMQGAASGRKRSAVAVYAAACLIAAPLAMVQAALAETNSVEVAAVMQASPSAANAAFIAPIGGDIRSAFGPRANPTGGEQQFHNGVDYDAPEGAEVVAPASGHVTRAVQQGGYGNLLEIDHGGGLVTRYAHLSAFEVSEGAQVSAGQLIARVGNTGRSTHPHLHFVVLRDGAPVDPETLLPSTR